jgi:glutaredoxin
MKYKLNLFIILPLLVTSLNCMAAVSIVECEDEQGNRTFQKTCPPGSTMINQKRIATGSKAAAENDPVTFTTTSSSVSATMYSIPECSPCDAVRELLQIKNIPLTEINIEGDIIKQAELTKLNGSLNVPVTLIGDKKLSGYNRTEIISALEAAGWKDPKKK